MITSQTLGTSTHPASLGGRANQQAVLLVRGAAAVLRAGIDLDLLRRVADRPEDVEAVMSLVRQPVG
jgi:hypothetical protein